MTPADFLALLQRSGFTVRLDAGKLLVSPASKLMDDERQALREHRDGLVVVLSGGAALAILAPTGPKARGPVAWLL